MRVLVIGHALGPGMGSEPGNTWNFAWHLAGEHEVTLLSHPQHRMRVEEMLSREARPHLKIHWVTLPPDSDPWNPDRGEKGLKRHYLKWQRAAAKLAEQLCATEEFDVVHHFSWGTVNAPPLLHRLSVPVVWGPIGGGQTMPLAFRKYFKGDLPREILRHATTRILSVTPSMRRMAKTASVVLVTNDETRRIVERAGARRVELFLDNGLAPGYTDHSTANRAGSDEMKILWAGRCEPRKALGLGLEAMIQVKAPVKLLVAGDGPLKAQWHARARELGLEQRVEFLGRVPWETMSRLFDQADVFLFTSLRDSFGSVVLEAMGHGLPILTLNHQGVRDCVPKHAGIKVSVHSPQQTAQELGEAIELLAKSPQQRRQMGQSALDFARTETWDRRIRRLVRLYQDVCGQNVSSSRSTSSPNRPGEQLISHNSAME